MASNRFPSPLHGRLPGLEDAAVRLVPWAVAGVLALVWGYDLIGPARRQTIENWAGPPQSSMDYLPVVAGALMCAAALVALRPRAGRALTTLCGVVAAAVMALASALLYPLPKGLFGYAFAPSEVLALLVLLSLAALRCRPWQIGVVALCAFAAGLTDYLREPSGYDVVSPALMMVVPGLAPGLYLRWRSFQRETHAERARAQERLAIARDLHDVVAHEVTGIVVQAQALRYIAERDPGAVRDGLPEIEAAGARALESMRGMVTRLREPDDVPLSPDLSGGLARLEAAASDGLPRVSVRCEGDVDGLPPTVGTAVLRIVQESVTNALRYARGAALVDTVVRAGPDGVAVEVLDDGREAGSGVGGGFGLVGMAERARILGGELSAGPRGGGHGWEVRAWLPLEGDS
ncbi:MULTISPECIES: sensor histidine kinase [Nocardiopsidaceae]|uniref:histidine kinase n=1 Tax=Streptomonospora nanhaiensis TaxID=1323731 RepID=A0ABY6YLC3_9ACTN|nr:histidine kinase [Streptomonospora nanhaiensis]WAE73169.1 histidine kinase [Streptomonospora nanhaiensis]